MAHFSIDHFRWSTTHTFLAHPAFLPLAWALYALAILALRAFMRPRPSLASNRTVTLLAAAHNLLLSLLSLLMFVGIARETVRAARSAYVSTPSVDAPLRALFCATETQPMPNGIAFWFYIFYLSKFYELLDTIILILRKKPLTLLQVWHHASVILETWGWINYNLTFAAFGMLFNTFVHLLMYSYFCASLLNIKVPWRRIVTSIQIVQFITSFVLSVPFLAYFFVPSPLSFPKGWKSVHWGGLCEGMPAWVISAVCNGSYLALFVRFYRRNYQKQDRGGAAEAPEGGGDKKSKAE